MTAWFGGKGSNKRPSLVSEGQITENYTRIYGDKPKRVEKFLFYIDSLHLESALRDSRFTFIDNKLIDKETNLYICVLKDTLLESDNLTTFVLEINILQLLKLFACVIEYNTETPDRLESWEMIDKQTNLSICKYWNSAGTINGKINFENL